MSNLTNKRVADYKARVSYDPKSEYVCSSSGIRYIPIHPFADEAVLLSELNMESRDCFSVDGWYLINGDVAFFEAIAKQHSQSDRSTGYYARKKESELNFIYLLYVTNSETITRSEFENALTLFATMEFPNGDIFSSLSGKYIVVAESA